MARTPSSVALALVLLASPAAAGNTWWVDAAGAPPGSGTSGDPYTSLQYAITRPATQDGDTLLVRPGTYVENNLVSGFVTLSGRTLVIASTDGAQATVLDTGGPGTVLTLVATGLGTRIEGFTLTGGDLVQGSGAGLRCSGATAEIVDCIVTGNTGFGTSGVGVDVFGGAVTLRGCTVTSNLGTNITDGAGVRAVNADLTLIDCSISDHEAQRGAGLFASGGTTLVQGTTFLRNDAGLGGGLYLGGGTHTVEDSTVESCDASRLTASLDGGGGGMHASGSGAVVVRDTLFTLCRADRGGAAQIGSGTLLEGCTFRANRARPSPGAGALGGAGGAVYGNGVARRCLFESNVAESFSLGGGACVATALEYCTVVDNDAGAPGGACEGGAHRGTIFWGNLPDQLSGAVASWCTVEGGWPGAGNLDQDPLFVAPGAGDWHLAAGSPCIDAGDPADPADPDGTPPDQGAFPTTQGPSAIAPLCFGDGSGAACPCGNTGAAGRGCENSFATGGGLLVGSGTPSVAADDVVLAASGLPSTAVGLYFQGTDAVAGGAGEAFGDGLRCAGGTVVRLGTKSSSGGASSFPAGGDPAVSVKGQLPAGGGLRRYQVWYRNVAPFCSPDGFNLTNALEIGWTP